MASLKAKVGMVTVNCNVQGASLIVDEVEKHETIPPEGVIFDPGIYKIKVAKVGYEPFVVQVNVVSGGNTSLDVNLKKIEGHVSIEPEEEPAKPRPKKKLANSYKWLIGGLVSGGLIAIGAVATGVVGQNEQNAMEDEACLPLCFDNPSGCGTPPGSLLLDCGSPVELPSSSSCALTLESLAGQAACLSCEARAGWTLVDFSDFGDDGGACDPPSPRRSWGPLLSCQARPAVRFRNPAP